MLNQLFSMSNLEYRRDSVMKGIQKESPFIPQKNATELQVVIVQ